MVAYTGSSKKGYELKGERGLPIPQR